MLFILISSPVPGGFHFLRLKELIYAAEMFAYATMTELIHLAYQSVQKISVVAYHY